MRYWRCWLVGCVDVSDFWPLLWVMGSTPVGDTCQKGLQFLPCPSSEGLSRDLQFPPSARKKKKILGTLWKVMQCGISQTPNFALAGVSPSSQVEKGMAAINKVLRLHYGCLWQPTEGLSMMDVWENSCLWHHSIMQVANESKKKKTEYTDTDKQYVITLALATSAWYQY